MEMRDMLKELVRENLTEDMLKEAVDEYIEEFMTFSMKDLIMSEVRSISVDKINELVTETYGKMLNAPVVVSNGWDAEEYDSFEAFLKESLRERFAKDWSVRSQVERMLKEKWDKTVKKIVNDFTKEELEKRAFKVLSEV